MKYWILVILLFAGLALKAQNVLSAEAQLSLITCGPGEDELYSAFGHSALRVKDSQQGIDLVFNYGIFDFDQPNFYLNFARGHLLYMLAVNRWSDFFRIYQMEGRFVREQVLNLDSTAKQKYWEFLVWNSAPENRDYLYDYFYDNCATRIRDGLLSALDSASVHFKDKPHYQPAKSIRELCDVYLAQQPWGDFAIDFCLGLPMDKRADAQIEMFLPDLLAEAFEEAQIEVGGERKSLVLSDQVIIPQKFSPEPAGINRPFFFSALLLVLGVLATIFTYTNPRALRWFDALIWLITSLLGFFLLALWLLTDHQAAAYNFNILVFNPLLIFPAIALMRNKWSSFSLKLMRYTPYYYALLLGAWLFLPQKMLISLIPLVALFILRGWYYYYKRSQF